MKTNKLLQLVCCLLLSFCTFACGGGVQRERAIYQAQIASLQQKTALLQKQLHERASANPHTKESSIIGEGPAPPMLLNAPNPTEVIHGVVNLGPVRMHGCGRFCWKIYNGSDLHVQVFSDGIQVVFRAGAKTLLSFAKAYKPGGLRVAEQISVIPPWRAGTFMTSGGEGNHSVTVIGYAMSYNEIFQTPLPDGQIMLMKGPVLIPSGMDSRGAWFPYRENAEGAGFQILGGMSPIKN